MTTSTLLYYTTPSATIAYQTGKLIEYYFEMYKKGFMHVIPVSIDVSLLGTI